MNDLYVVGIGPGAYEKMTLEAIRTLESCRAIAGYTVYIDLIRDHFPDKEYIITPMRQEEARCRMALEKAAAGCPTALVCSGDSGVYGMAGLVLELLPDYPDVHVKVIPGVTAALAGGALLGAPLSHDLAIISLSDLLTPMEKIRARLQAVAAADLVICLYNPSSKKRKDHLKMACDIVLGYRHGDTVCGIVKNIGRDGQELRILTLSALAETEVDMFTTVFIGNSQTKRIGPYMVTPRGYTIAARSLIPSPETRS